MKRLLTVTALVAMCALAGGAASAAPAAPAAEAGQGPELLQGMMMRHQMMVMSRINKDDPAALLAMHDELKLSDEQVGKLEEIQKDDQTRALAVLTDEQRKALESIPDEPRSMMGVYRRAMRGMMQARGGMMGMRQGARGAGMMQGMAMRNRMMMMSGIDKNGPAALLAIGNALSLSDEQVAKLEAIQKDGQTRALAVLTDEQRKSLQPIPDEPRSIMDMYGQMTPMTGGMMQGRRGMMGMQQGAQGAGTTQGIMMRHRMMLMSGIDKSNPAALLALGDVLELNDEQVGQLKQIRKDDQERALAVLTDEQRKLLDSVPNEPLSMAGMYRHMMPRMGGMMQGPRGMMGGSMMQGMMMRRRMMMMSDINNSDPAALLAMHDTLALNDEQVGKLEKIEKDDQTEALAVLTDEQRKTLEPIPDEPRSMMGMYRHMMPMMGGMMQARRGMMGGSMMQQQGQ